MKYMKRVGYDPWAGVTLQEAFVRLSARERRESRRASSTDCSHLNPPSEERVEKNKVTAEALGRGGELGDANVRRPHEAADRHEAGLRQARQGARCRPQEGLRAGAQACDRSRRGAFRKKAASSKRSAKSLWPRRTTRRPPRYYEKAIQLDPDYFGSYLGAGVAQLRTGNKAKAEELFTRSSKLLPTAPAAYYLGELAKGRGDTQKAMQFYQAAASSQSEVGKAAAGELVRLDLPQNPGNYVAAAGQLDANGRVVLVVQNRAPIKLTDIRVTPVLVNAAGQIVTTGGTVRITQPLDAGTPGSG